MEYVTVQTKNVRKDVKERAELAAKEAGFSSLQDVIRLAIVNIASGNLDINFGLSPRQVISLKKSISDYKKGNYTVLTPNTSLSEQIFEKNGAKTKLPNKIYKPL